MRSLRKVPSPFTGRKSDTHSDSTTAGNQGKQQPGLRNIVQAFSLIFRVRTRRLFSEDGKTALPGKRTHRMRRSFAKGWRNARWRDMLLAFLFWLSDGESLIRLPLASEADIKVELPPLMFVSPVSVSEGEEDVTDEDESGEEFTEDDEESDLDEEG